MDSYNYPLYTEQEIKELLSGWSNTLAIEQPELTEEIVRSIVEGESNGEKTS